MHDIITFDNMEDIIKMINTQYDKLTDIGAAVKAPATEISKTAAQNEEETAIVASSKRDVFEYSVSESVSTYSPETIKTGANSADTMAVSSSVSHATTNAQKKMIPKLLAAKMAGITNTYADGTPMLTTWEEHNAYAQAQQIIRGDHANLSYKKDYCYVQNVSGPIYGLSTPKSACGAFAFATALSIKNGRRITPEDVKTNGVNRIVESSLGDEVLLWQTKSGEKGYRITDSEGERTLEGIDAQLQLGNPAVLHLKREGSSEQHWVTVIGKQNGEYTVIDPYDGAAKSLSSLRIMRKDEEGKDKGIISDYAIVSDEY